MNSIWADKQAALDKSLGELMKALKAEVKGRGENAYVDYQPFAEANDVPMGFLYNAIESNLIERRRERSGAHWCEGDPMKGIEIPSDFGLSLL